MSNNIPIDEGAERGVLGSLFLEPELYSELSRVVSTDDFSSDKNREIWVSMVECILEGHLDLVVLDAKLKSRKTLDKIGGIKAVIDIVNNTPTSEAAMKYASIVAEYGERRRKLKGLNLAASQIADLGTDISSTDEFIQNVILAPTGKGRTVDFGGAFEEFKKDYDERKARGNTLPGILTGYPDLDIMLGGFEKAKMYVVGGRPSMGKTAYALNIAARMAKSEHLVMYFSLEMGQAELVKRVLGIGTGIPIKKMKTCKLTGEEETKISEYKEKLNKYFLINDTSYQTMAGIMTEVIGKNAELSTSGRHVECVIIDHLQLISASASKYTDRRNQIGEASRMCKIMSKELKIPVIVLSQLSRALKDRTSYTPRLTDLRESGDIEQDADVVILLHRDGYYDPEADQKEAKAYVAKNRDGNTGVVKYSWYKDRNIFAENTDPNCEIM